MKEIAVARRYAKAFAEEYGEPATLEQMVTELREFADIFDSHKDLRGVMLNPSVHIETKLAILEAILTEIGVSSPTCELLNLLFVRGRAKLIRLVASEFEKRSFDILGKVRVEVTSATELTEKDKAFLASELSRLIGKEAVMNTSVDPSLIGGVVARVGSVLYDGTILSQLKALKVALG